MHFVIVLIDYLLPGMSGTELLKKIRLYKKDMKASTPEVKEDENVDPLNKDKENEDDAPKD